MNGQEGRISEHLPQKEKQEQSSQYGPEPVHLGFNRREVEWWEKSSARQTAVMQRVLGSHAQTSGSYSTCSGSHWRAVRGRMCRADWAVERPCWLLFGVRETWWEALWTWSWPWNWKKEDSGWVYLVQFPLTLGVELRGLPDELDGTERKEGIQTESWIFSKWVKKTFFYLDGEAWRRDVWIWGGKLKDLIWIC